MTAEWTPPAEAVEAAWSAFDWPGHTSDRAGMVAALTAAGPALVAEAVAAERERIAQAIEADKFPDGPGGAFGPSTRTWDEALGAAARIARTTEGTD